MLVRLNSYAYLFISARNASAPFVSFWLFVSNRVKFRASVTAASLPDGSMRPNRRSLMEISSPLARFAVVPPTLSAYHVKEIDEPLVAQ